MNAINYTTDRKELAGIMENVCQNCDPMIITKNKDYAVVMISLADYLSMAETDQLLRSPANAERLHQSIASSRCGKGSRMTMDQFEEILRCAIYCGRLKHGKILSIGWSNPPIMWRKYVP